jgi:hypothetical protein
MKEEELAEELAEEMVEELVEELVEVVEEDMVASGKALLVRDSNNGPDETSMSSTQNTIPRNIFFEQSTQPPISPVSQLSFSQHSQDGSNLITDSNNSIV